MAALRTIRRPLAIALMVAVAVILVIILLGALSSGNPTVTVSHGTIH